MKNILILTAATGAGHNQVASTLENALINNGHNVTQMDFVKEHSKMMEFFVENGYLVLAKKFPKIYGQFYKLSNTEKMNAQLSKMLTTAHSKSIKSSLKKQMPDLIIGTHPFAINIITQLKEEGFYNNPFVSVVTDYEAHYTYISQTVDLFIVGSDFTKQGLIEKGISSDKIAPLGIPISPVFYEPSTVQKSDIFTILLMGGSMGLDPMKKSFINLLSIKRNIKLIVVCGNNHLLRSELSDIAYNIKPSFPIELLGYTNEVAKLMDSADVIITKPGGITVSEAIAKNLPMIVPYYIPGQEAENLNFLNLVNFAIEASNPKFLNRIIYYLIDNPERLLGMKEAMAKISIKYDQQRTIELIEQFLYARR